MKKMIVVVLFMLAGCDEVDPAAPDQCLRREIFRECLQTVPAGPQRTVTNDWAEVIDECQSAAYYQSLRSASRIKPECKA